MGPRVGTQLHERKIRFKEWLGLIPFAAVTIHVFMAKDPSTSTILMEASLAGIIARILPALEAFGGKTMRDIDRLENLRR